MSDDSPVFELDLTRVIDAPRARVFEAWATPERMVQWFAPRPFRLAIDQMDFRPGGRFRVRMLGPNGEDFPSAGTYRDISPPARIQMSDAFPGDPEDSILTTVTFEEQGPRTELHVHQSFLTMSPMIEMATRGALEGWTTTLDQLQVHAEIASLEQGLCQAIVRRDPGWFEEFVADDAVLLSHEGVAMPKSLAVELHGPGSVQRYTRVDLGDLRVFDHGATAVATSTDSYQSDRGTAIYGMLRVWARENGRWQVVAGSATLGPIVAAPSRSRDSEK